MKKKKALIAGASGLVGGQLLDLLLDDPYYQEVIAITRRPIDAKHDKLMNVVSDFSALAECKEKLKAHDVFCCLGTTIKKAGSKENFRKVDYEYPVALGRLALENGAEQYLLISALGADENSSIFYNQVKGEVEKAITQLNYETLHIFRPALLMGPREESRKGEDAAKSFFKAFGFLFVGPLKKYKAIDSVKVARAMHAIAKRGDKGKYIHESKDLQNY